MIQPLYNNVLLKKVEASRETKSGIIISQKEESEEYAQVVALSGAKEVKVNDHVYEMPLNVGDKVMYKKYSGTDVKDGNDVTQLRQAFAQHKEKMPRCIIANTIKGKGVSFMENDILWHFRDPQGELYERAIAELEAVR